MQIRLLICSLFVEALPLRTVDWLNERLGAAVVLCLWRHGEQPDNLGAPRDRRLSGWTNVRLTSRGCQQALRAGEQARFVFRCFRRPIVVSSDVLRSLQTTVLFLVGLDWPCPVALSPLARERNAGLFNGMTRAEAVQAGCEVINSDGGGQVFVNVEASYATPEEDPTSPGESARDVQRRGMALLSRVLLVSWLLQVDMVGVSTHEIWIKVVRATLIGDGELTNDALLERVEHANVELHLIGHRYGRIRSIDL